MDSLILESLKRYFNTLNKFGYVSYNKVFELLIIIHIGKLKSDLFKNLVSNDDSKLFDNVVQCITSRNCLIQNINK